MNVYDSDKLWQQLAIRGYQRALQPQQADLVLVNTCAIREKAEQKLYSFLGRMAQLKQKRPQMNIGVCGCVAQQRGADIFRRVPQVDMVFGTDTVFQLPQLLQQALNGKRVLQNNWKPLPPGRVEDFIPEVIATSLPTSNTASLTGQIAITKGCNNLCTFCVVPYTRGREVSRRAGQILAETRALVAAGVKEITLLGQNVNSYRAEGVSFVHLLKMLNNIKDLDRIRYISPHPKDFDAELAQAHRDLPALCEHLHLPLQSGSNRILKRMRRRYTIETYLEKIELARHHVPQIAISTDLIVGFPGETEADFQQTLNIAGQLRFHHLYAFKYSSRPGTPAADMSNQLPEKIKQERLTHLLKLQQQIVHQHYQKLIDTCQQVLVERHHPRSSSTQPLMSGRTRGNIPVILPGQHALGALLDVFIASFRQNSLVAHPPAPFSPQTAA